MRTLAGGADGATEADVEALIEKTKGRPTQLQSSVEVATGNWIRKDNRFALRPDALPTGEGSPQRKTRASGRTGGAGGDWIASLRDADAGDSPQLMLAVEVKGLQGDDTSPEKLHKALREALKANLTRTISGGTQTLAHTQLAARGS